MSANFSLGNGNKWGGFYEVDTGERTMIGDLPADPDNLYLIDYRNGLDTVLVPVWVEMIGMMTSISMNCAGNLA